MIERLRAPNPHNQNLAVVRNRELHRMRCSECSLFDISATDNNLLPTSYPLKQNAEHDSATAVPWYR